MTGGGRRDGASIGGAGGGAGRKTLGKKCPKYSRGPQTGPALLGPQLAVATRWSCNFSAFCNPTELATSLQPNFSATQLLYATQLLCILQPKGARNFRATELVCIPTKLSRSSRAAQELPAESQKNLIFVIRFNWCLVSGILTT